MRIRRRSAVVPGRIPTPNPLDARVAVAASLVGQERHEVFKALVKEGHDRYVVAPVGLLQRAYGVPEGFDWKLGLDHRMVAVNMRRSRPSWSAPVATRAPATSPPPGPLSRPRFAAEPRPDYLMGRSAPDALRVVLFRAVEEGPDP